MSDRPARRLFEVAPSAYVDERARLAKAARAAGDKELARTIQGWKRPTLAMWAVLAAGVDESLVRGLFSVTADLAEAQASGDRDATIEATQSRRASVEAVTSAAVDALAEHDPAADAKRPEIRTLIDQLSRHAEVVDAWVDGTLRDLPDGDGFGFAAFTGLEVTARPPAPKQAREPAARASRALRSVPDAPNDDRPTRDPQLDRAERAARAARAAERRDAMRARERAASVLAATERKLAGADARFREAEAELAAARAEHNTAAERHARAVEQVDRLARE